jgi:plastocyanin
MDSHDKEPIILTSPGRISRGIIIVGITLAIGAAFTVTFFDEMFANPPPVTQIKQPTPPTPPAEAGTTTIAILAGSSVQGSPDFGPDPAQVPLGNKIVWENQDNILHTATSGTSSSDPDSGKAFDTGFLDGGAKSKPIELADAKVGDSFNYYCQVHPYMTGALSIVAAETGGAPSGPTIDILAGASVQGSPAYSPDPLTVKKGDKITVVNKDNTLHTVTDGTTPGADAGKLFNTGFLEGGQSKTIDTANLGPAEYNYFCEVHPYMAGKLKVE